MSKTFNKFFDDVLEEYAQIRIQMPAGVNTAHYLEQARREIKNHIMSWFVSHVEAIAASEERLKDELFE